MCLSQAESSFEVDHILLQLVDVGRLAKVNHDFLFLGVLEELLAHLLGVISSQLEALGLVEHLVSEVDLDELGPLELLALLDGLVVDLSIVCRNFHRVV